MLDESHAATLREMYAKACEKEKALIKITKHIFITRTLSNIVRAINDRGRQGEIDMCPHYLSRLEVLYGEFRQRVA